MYIFSPFVVKSAEAMKNNTGTSTKIWKHDYRVPGNPYDVTKRCVGGTKLFHFRHTTQTEFVGVSTLDVLNFNQPKIFLHKPESCAKVGIIHIYSDVTLSSTSFGLYMTLPCFN